MPDKTKKESQVVVINDKEYKVDDLNEKQVMQVNHVADLDRKILQGKFNLSQMEGGRIYHMELLEKELEKTKDNEEVVEG